MAIPISPTPTLMGKSAQNFLDAANRNSKTVAKGIDFAKLAKDTREILKNSKL